MANAMFEIIEHFALSGAKCSRWATADRYSKLMEKVEHISFKSGQVSETFRSYAVEEGVLN